MGSTRPTSLPRARRASFASLGALAAANVRYWPSVAPVVREELRLCGRQAQLIADAKLRELAVAKHAEERFNAEVVATLATLAPRSERASVVRAIVALELLFDYLDGRTELPSADPVREGMRLFAALAAAVEPEQALPQGAATPWTQEPDSAYMRALGARTRENLLALPAAGQVIDLVRASVERSVQAQTCLHAAGLLGDEQLRDWASAPAEASGLGWREYLGGSASSVLSAHALLAAAADPATTAADAARIDAAYIAIGGVITMLDSVVDHRADNDRGEPGFIRLFDAGELEQAMRALTREALARAREAPHGAHHEMTLAGVVAYYTTHPGARDPHARAIVAMLRRELAPTIWPGLCVLRGWRAAKSTRASLPARAGEDVEPTPRRRRRRRMAPAVLLAAAATALLALTATWSASASTSPAAHVARSLSVRDEGSLKFIKSSGSVLTDEGPVHGTIPGKVRVRFLYNDNPTVTAHITIFGHSGTLLAHGSGRLSSPTSPSPSFSGTLTIDGGSGRYAHAHGRGRLYGVFYRRSYAMTVQTQGTLSY